MSALKRLAVLCSFFLLMLLGLWHAPWCATLDENALKAMKWRQVVRSRGGRALAGTGVAGDR